jgi:hypothetical protein
MMKHFQNNRENCKTRGTAEIEDNISLKPNTIVALYKRTSMIFSFAEVTNPNVPSEAANILCG